MYEDYCVLFVDDEPNILNTIRRSLMDEEYLCSFAGSGKEALELIRLRQIAVIVTDMRMPEMTGLDLLTKVDEVSPETVKIVLSGYTQLPQVLVTINKVDIFKFITKPWDTDDFIVAIRKALDFYIIRDENAKYKKVLEAKNTSYKNILKKVNEVVDDAKISRELITLCGKAILGFDKSFTTGEKIKFQKIFSLQEKLFELLSQGITTLKKDMKSTELIQSISNHVTKIYPEVSLETNNEIPRRIIINLKMLETSIDALCLVFAEEFRQCGLFCRIDSREQFSMTMIVPNADLTHPPKGISERSVIDLKIELLQTVLEKVLELCQIKFQVSKTKGSLVIEIISETSTETDEDKKGVTPNEKDSDRG